MNDVSNRSMLKYSEEILALIKQGCDELYHKFHLPVLFLDKDDKITYEHCALGITPPHYVDGKEAYFSNILVTQNEFYPMIYKTKEELYYICSKVHYSKSYYGRYIVGPIIDKEYAPTELKLLYNNQEYSTIEYYQSITIKNIEIIRMYTILCENLISDVLFEENQNNYMFFQKNQQEYQTIHSEEIIHQISHEHIGYNIDKIIIESVKNGYPEEIKKFIGDYYKYTGRRELLDTTLMNRKYFSISYVATLIQASIDGGMDYNVASQLNMKYIKLIENKVSSSQLESLEMDVAYALSYFVKNIKRKGNTKLIRDCKDYIIENISSNLKIYLIAKNFMIDSKYLSRRFKKETGENIKNYINRKKVEEAKRLMQSTNIELIDIATNLSFNDQSHFTKVFKEYALMTPKQYYLKIKSK